MDEKSVKIVEELSDYDGRNEESHNFGKMFIEKRTDII